MEGVTGTVNLSSSPLTTLQPIQAWQVPIQWRNQNVNELRYCKYWTILTALSVGSTSPVSTYKTFGISCFTANLTEF